MSMSIAVSGAASQGAASSRSRPKLPAAWLLAALFAVAVAVAVAVVLARRQAAETNRYVTAAVSRGSVTQAVNSSGTVNPGTIVQVGSYVSGVIQTISCDFNTRVKAGQLCARIDPRPYQTAVDQEAASLATARAQVAKDRANLEYTEVVAQRDAGLLKRGVVSQETADTSASNHAQAAAQLVLDQAGVAQREAQLRSARINLGYADIVSPVSGTVVSRNVTQGQTVAASFQTPTLFLIATDLTQMQVDTNVSEADIGRVAGGQAARFTVTAFPDREFSGTVQQVRQAPQSVQNVVTYDAVVAVSNPDLALKPGMTASMRIVTHRVDDVLRVPDQALRFRPTQLREGADAVDRRARPGRGEGSQRAVWVLRDGRPQQAAVTIGLDDDTFSEVTAGPLREGDLLIVSERAGAGTASPLQPAGLAAPRR
jgi:HlyD family secretion protein